MSLDPSEELERQFSSIVQDLDMAHLKDLNELSAWEIQRAIAGMNEASTYLGRFLMEYFHDPEIQLPLVIVPLIRSIIDLTDNLSTVVSSCYCSECMAECQHDIEDVCERCMGDDFDLEA